jgi:hypothetical protein
VTVPLLLREHQPAYGAELTAANRGLSTVSTVGYQGTAYGIKALEPELARLAIVRSVNPRECRLSLKGRRTHLPVVSP